MVLHGITCFCNYYYFSGIFLCKNKLLMQMFLENSNKKKRKEKNVMFYENGSAAIG